MVKMTNGGRTQKAHNPRLRQKKENNNKFRSGDCTSCDVNVRDDDDDDDNNEDDDITRAEHVTYMQKITQRK